MRYLKLSRHESQIAETWDSNVPDDADEAMSKARELAGRGFGITAPAGKAFDLLLELSNRAFARRRDQQTRHLRLLDADESEEAAVGLADPGGLLRALFDGLPVPILIADAGGAVLDANETALSLLGYGRRPLLNLTLSEMIPAPGEWLERELEGLEVRREWRAILELRRSDGLALPAEITIRFVETAAGPVVILAVEDVTERRATVQRQHEALDNAEHKVRDALTPVVGLTHVLLKTESVDRETLREIAGLAQRLEKNVRELVDAARGTADAGQEANKLLDIADLLEGAVEDAQRATYAHRISLFTPRGSLLTDWEPGLINRIFLSLLHHAVSSSPAGGSIQVTATTVRPDIRVCVRDYGLGISEADMPTVFARFERPAAMVAAPAGAGLGLHLLKELVELRGGRLWVESEGPGRGSTFSFSLPSLTA